MSLIVDISRWQGVIPTSTFRAWKAAGVARVVVKAGGADSGIYKDADHDQNVANARAAGLDIDHYFFNGPGDPAAHARAFVAYAAPRSGDRLWYDVENEGSMPHATPAAAATFGATTKALCGILAGLYMSSSVTKSANWSGNVALGQELWVAQYGVNDGDPHGAPSIGYWKAYTYWQYTSNETLPSYGGRLDASLPSSARVLTSAPAAAPTSSQPLEDDMAYSIVPDAKSATIYVCSLVTGKRAGIKSPYHVTLLQRYKANNSNDKMLVAELDIVASYLNAINPPPKVAAPSVTVKVDQATIEAAVAAAVKSVGGTADASAIADAVLDGLHDRLSA